MKNVLGTLMSSLMCIYLFVWGTIFVSYYNWQYANTNGFVSWLYWGDFAATSKAFAWPYYVIAALSETHSKDWWEKIDDTSTRHFAQAEYYTNKAAEIETTSGLLGTHSDFEKTMALYRLALEEAKQVDINSLNAALPTLGDHYRDQYIQGLAIYANDDSSIVSAFKGRMLVHQWATWFDSELKVISN